MILIGTMNLTRTADYGQFYCPTCCGHQDYRLRARRPFLTLYFIPVVPIGGAEMFVDCVMCRDKWDPSILEMEREQYQEIEASQFHGEVLRAAILVVLADGAISESEISTLQGIAGRLHGREYDREELGELCSAAAQNRIGAGNYLLSVSRRWTQLQRSLALQAIFLAATAEGKMGETQTRLVSSLRDILEMTDQEYEDSIEASFQWELN